MPLLKGKRGRRESLTVCRRHLASQSVCMEPWTGEAVPVAGVIVMGRESSAGPHAGRCGAWLPPSVKESMTVRTEMSGLVSQAQLGLYFCWFFFKMFSLLLNLLLLQVSCKMVRKKISW